MDVATIEDGISSVTKTHMDEHTPLLSQKQSYEEDEDYHGSEKQESWNNPPINTSRFLSTNLSFMIMGMNDACIGALIPYMLTYYDISYAAISLLFVVPTAGYIAAAITNHTIHHAVGQRGIAILGATCRIIAYIPLALHPPFAILPFVMILTGLGNGLNNGAWNAWVGGLSHSNELLGLLHGAYGFGGIIAPLIASAMIVKLNQPWYAYYYIMIALSILEMFLSTSSFWTSTGAAFRDKHRSRDGRPPVTYREVLRSPVPWIAAMFIFAYSGVEVSLGGWTPTFMIKIRHAEPFVAGITATLFWSGLTFGRVTLGFFTGRIGEKLTVLVYIIACAVFQLIFWLIPVIVSSIISVFCLGFFLGPLFPAMIVTISKLLPADRHVAAIGLCSAIGGGGAAFLPFVAGSLAEEFGVQILQPFVLFQLCLVAVIWLVFPGGFRRGGLEQARREGVSWSTVLKREA